MPETSGWNGFGPFLYKYAAQFAGKGAVLDIGCGIGKGAALLADRTREEVWGIDHSEKAIRKAARETAGRKNLVFREMDIRTLASLRKRFGLITLFNTIEHVTAAEQERLMVDIRALLAPGGTVLIETNNRRCISSNNPFHKNELTATEFETLIGKYFRADFFGIRQQTHPAFKMDGARNKLVNFCLGGVFMQESILPLIPQVVKDMVNIQFLKLYPPVETDFAINRYSPDSEYFLAVGR